jgi:hypothetical protein
MLYSLGFFLIFLCIFFVYFFSYEVKRTSDEDTNYDGDICSFHLYPLKKFEVILTDFFKKYKLMKGV